jgi:hypothetical protein
VKKSRVFLKKGQKSSKKPGLFAKKVLKNKEKGQKT